MTRKQKRVLIRIIIAFLFVCILSILRIGKTMKSVLFLIPYITVGGDILKRAFEGIKNRQPFDENFLMAVATVGAFLLGEYAEGVFVMLFYQLGELFQGYAVSKSRKNIAQLMDIRPDYVLIEDEDGQLKQEDPYCLSVGDLFYVKAGEKIALDGVIVEGSASIDTVALTGESIPRTVTVGDDVLSGSINISGSLKIRATKEFDQSTASKILELVENASSNKSSSENFISKFASIYTPVVCLSALLIAFLPPVITLIIKGDNQFGEWIYRALTFLVISCPCALVVSVPLSFFAAIGGAGRYGILIKGANFIEKLSKSKCIVFDKTGTLTRGVFEVSEIQAFGVEKDVLLDYACHAECYSNHPISKSLQNTLNKPLDKSRVSCFTEISGFGISAKIDNKKVFAGNAALMKQQNIEYVECEKSGTVVHVSLENKYLGYILISDIVKDNARYTIADLKRNGIRECIMLTGDRREIAKSVAENAGIDRYKYEMLPQDKVDYVSDLIKTNEFSGNVVFVGDGINDAPVLACSDIGVSMGALGSDAAIEASDVVLMDDNIGKLLTALKISKKCMNIVYQNIYFSLGVKLLVLILGALGIVNMWIAVFADVGVMFLAVLNAIRTMKI